MNDTLTFTEEEQEILAKAAFYTYWASSPRTLGFQWEESEEQSLWFSIVNSVARAMECVFTQRSVVEVADEVQKQMSFRDAGIAYFSFTLTKRKQIAEELGVIYKEATASTPDFIRAREELLTIQRYKLQDDFIAMVEKIKAEGSGR